MHIISRRIIIDIFWSLQRQVVLDDSKYIVESLHYHQRQRVNILLRRTLLSSRTTSGLSKDKVSVKSVNKLGHISVNMSPTDLRQVSKFSFGRYLKLFTLHPKDFVDRKNFVGEPKISFFIFSLYIFIIG